MTNESTNMQKNSAGDPISPKCSVIEVHVGELKQLFDAIDPSAFRNRDLDPKAAEFIVGWAKDLPHDAQLALVVDLDREAGLPAAARRDSRVLQASRRSISTTTTRIIPGGPDQPGDGSACLGGRDCAGRFSCHRPEGRPYWRDPHDRRGGVPWGPPPGGFFRLGGGLERKGGFRTVGRADRA